ncbi:MAG: Bax inhibitor-1/YccA family protein [Ignavibacteriales bacterium]|nr:Bax inhibitor-1/YccA family protein [Ignavibacteriales bacterium]
MRTANPALSAKTFQNLPAVASPDEAMTLQGTVNKSGLLLLLVVASAAYTWNLFFASGDASAVTPYILGGALGGFVVALITVFKKTWSPVTAPLYAVLEGLFLGGISALMEMEFSGIVIQAVAMTFGVFMCLLLAYRSGLIKATENFKLGVTAATGGIAVIYIITMLLGFWGIQMPYIHESGIVGIGFSVFVVILAALNLVLDFDFIENGAEQGAPKYMEWYASFGLLVTLIWLYLEILRLLAKTRRN